MNREQILRLFEKLDGALRDPARLWLYGSGVFILLGEPGRTSVDLDVAGPYSQANMADLRRAAEEIGYPVNPDECYSGDYIEWVGPLGVCLPEPEPGGRELRLWEGKLLRVAASPPPDLAASKLIRYDESDRADLQFLHSQHPWEWESVRKAVDRLPEQFRNDPMLRDNLLNLRTDMRLWSGR